MKENQLLTGLWKLLKKALEHENAVTVQKRLVEKLYKQEYTEQCCS